LPAPAEGALDHPAAGLDGKSLLPLELAHDLDRKIHEPRLVHERLAIMGGIAKQVLEPRPALLQGIEHQLGTRRIGDRGGRQVHCQPPAIGIDGDMAASLDLLVGVVSPLVRHRRLDRRG
jgi:hypothetical protein